MKLWQARRARLGAGAMLLSLMLVACGGGGGEDKPDAQNGDKGSTSDGATRTPAGPEVDSSKVIAELKGSNDMVLKLHSAVRDEGGFVTVTGTLTNNGERTFNYNLWSSAETSVRSKSSISGATLVDTANKKRYMILRDTDGECLCTTGLTGIKPNEGRAVHAQFPAPPKDVKEVQFQLPTMTPATIELTDG
ncbi:hypothetical protein H3146_22935 [Streptomyces sp. OF3]|uniref:Secreted protein n=1 Tax=Streptomyces alkaliterrae TaxID=2213162 RepID=A0A7W3WPR1_9ACTN|nr:hypothetical protein [Streptomyces alkaliterrae]MBB1256191.1 hypothetical protein [Streptomyces alkaliterrae]